MTGRGKRRGGGRRKNRKIPAKGERNLLGRGEEGKYVTILIGAQTPEFSMTSLYNVRARFRINPRRIP